MGTDKYSVVKSGKKFVRGNIDKILVNDAEVGDGNTIASAFNDFFVSVGSNISNSLQCQPDSHKQYLKGNYIRSFYFSPVSSFDKATQISSLKNKPSHFDCIPAIALKHISNIVSPVICSIINNSLSNGIFPNSLKIAKVVPIYKQGNRANIINYRPISLLPIISKILEKVVHKQIYSYLCKYNILSSDQFGFRPGKSTVNAMVNFMHYLYNSLDNRNFVFSMFLDFKKAFDSVDHKILLSKMCHYGVRQGCCPRLV